MSRLLTEQLKNTLPRLRGQEVASDPVVYAAFHFPGSDWIWFATEGELVGSDFTFFGYVIGFEREWGNFSLRELEAVHVHGLSIERDCHFEPRTLSRCLSDVGLD